jgi:hypothetical protein
LALILVTILMTGLNPAEALAQCGGDHSGNMGGQQMMGSSGHMGSGQTGMYGNQTPVQPDPNAGYVLARSRPRSQGIPGRRTGAATARCRGMEALLPVRAAATNSYSH